MDGKDKYDVVEDVHNEDVDLRSWRALLAGCVAVDHSVQADRDDGPSHAPDTPSVRRGGHCQIVGVAAEVGIEVVVDIEDGRERVLAEGDG